ncbi:MAG: CarD family transcriptional regulator [Parasporobacterium sp.]|nr:CarD family transcriptional regulator [Parasporobacterium sp.]
MFGVGDLIVYGTTGVCIVEEIGVPELSAASDKPYYTLTPYYTNKSKIFTPCDNDKIVMRPLLTKKEAEALINAIDTISLITIESEKLREETYKSILKRCDLKEFISLMKTIHARKVARLADGKKVTASDEKYYSMVEDKLYGELSISLGVERSELKETISCKVMAVG